MGRNILVVSQYFYPENFRINDICKEWTKRGHNVTVLTGIPNYPEGKFYQGYKKKKIESWNQINIERINIIPRGKSRLMLILNYLSFVISGFFWKLKTKTNADIVFIYEVSPMTQALPGIWYAKKKKIPVILYVTDLWPDNIESITRIRNKVLLKPINIIVDYIYKNATRIFTSSKSFIKSINVRNIDLEKLEFWPHYAEDFYIPINIKKSNNSEIPCDDFFNIIFAGNIGYAQGLDILPSVAKILYDKGIKVRFNIVGEGRFKKDLISMVKRIGLLEMFNFIERQPPAKIPELMALSDAALICLAKSEVFSNTIPSKTQSCLASGIPILVSADGEIQDIISEANAGLCSNAGDEYGLAYNIEKMVGMRVDVRNQMTINGLLYNKSIFNKEKLLDRMDYWIIQLTN